MRPAPKARPDLSSRSLTFDCFGLLLVIQADIAEQQARRESVLAAAFEDAIEEAASAKLAAAPSETPSAPGARRVRDHS
jgi:hypothetical protein